MSNQWEKKQEIQVQIKVKHKRYKNMINQYWSLHNICQSCYLYRNHWSLLASINKTHWNAETSKVEPVSNLCLTCFRHLALASALRHTDHCMSCRRLVLNVESAWWAKKRLAAWLNIPQSRDFLLASRQNILRSREFSRYFPVKNTPNFF